MKLAVLQNPRNRIPRVKKRKGKKEKMVQKYSENPLFTPASKS